MKEIVFVNEQFPDKSHTLTASLNMDGYLVFNDGRYYGADSREVDDYLLVRADHKIRLLDLLDKVFNGISHTYGKVVDERLFYTLERIARSGRWKSLDEVETWLMDRNIPFTKQRLIGAK